MASALRKRANKATRRVERLRTERSNLGKQIKWFREFDPGRAVDARDVAAEQASLASADVSRLDLDLDGIRLAKARWRQQARLKLDPSSWFSAKRHWAKTELSRLRSEESQVRNEHREASDRLRHRESEVAAWVDDLHRFENFDLVRAAQAIEAIDGELPLREMEATDLRQRADALEKELRGPLRQRKDYSSQLDALRSELEDISFEMRDCRADRARAERMADRLNVAASGYERALIHEECERVFGNGRPGAVARERRHRADSLERRSGSIRGQIDALARNLEKVDQRVDELTRRASRDVRAIVLDGNNLCFEGRTFIGLAALQALIRAVEGRYEVTAIFDASARGLLEVSDRDLEGILAGVRVHVVPGGTSADETIVAAAADPAVFVVSNDRFVEYRQAPAVRGDRILRHNIVGGRVMVHDLRIDVPYAAT